jgi:hypothetical protein
LGQANSLIGFTYGGEFLTNRGIGVLGEAVATDGINYGVYGQSNSTSGTGVYGVAILNTGTTYGVYGQSNSPAGRAVYGLSTNTSSGGGDAVFGQASSTAGRGTVGYATAGSGTTYGMWGQADSTNGRGVFGYAPAGTGLTYGVWGQADSTNGRGVFGYAPAGTGLTYGVFGQAGLNGWAVFALGDMGATGLKPFRIDHPTDPENKYLLHYATESPYPQNFYSGNTVTDGSGYAWVQLPEYFADVNANYKYQLTVIGKVFAQAIVAEEIVGNRFQIQTSAPGVKVSWRVEADRNDPYVRFKKPRDVVAKQVPERGTYQHPELYGQPAERGMNFRPQAERPSGEVVNPAENSLPKASTRTRKNKAEPR